MRRAADFMLPANPGFARFKPGALFIFLECSVVSRDDVSLSPRAILRP